METGDGYGPPDYTCELEPSTDELAGVEGANGVNGRSDFDHDIKSKNVLTLPPGRHETADTGQSTPGRKFGGDEAERRYKIWLRAEIVGLCIVIVIVWGLLFLPIIFYHLPIVSDRHA